VYSVLFGTFSKDSGKRGGKSPLTGCNHPSGICARKQITVGPGDLIGSLGMLSTPLKEARPFLFVLCSSPE
jgi:hypothetical protein